MRSRDPNFGLLPSGAGGSVSADAGGEGEPMGQGQRGMRPGSGTAPTRGSSCSSAPSEGSQAAGLLLVSHFPSSALGCGSWCGAGSSGVPGRWDDRVTVTCQVEGLRCWWETRGLISGGGSPPQPSRLSRPPLLRSSGQCSVLQLQSGESLWLTWPSLLALHSLPP